jgi:hypothetical protein
VTDSNRAATSDNQPTLAGAVMELLPMEMRFPNCRSTTINETKVLGTSSTLSVKILLNYSCSALITIVENFIQTNNLQGPWHPTSGCIVKSILKCIGRSVCESHHFAAVT